MGRADGMQTVYLSNRAQCLFEQGFYERSEADLSRALQIDGRDPELLYRRGITRFAQREYSECIADLKAALQYDQVEAHLPDIFYHLGVAYANLGKHHLAVPAYDQAISRNPLRPHYLHERAKSLQVVGEHDKALHDFSSVIDMQPTNARAKEFAPDDPRLVINYRKVYSVACISLGPAGHEDPEPSAVPILREMRECY